jgi:hypothetical protein
MLCHQRVQEAQKEGMNYCGTDATKNFPAEKVVISIEGPLILALGARLAL